MNSWKIVGPQWGAGCQILYEKIERNLEECSSKKPKGHKKYVSCVEAPLDRSKAQVGWGHNGVGGGVGWGEYLHTRNI